MINNEELKALIAIEEKVKSRELYNSDLGYDYYEPNDEIEEECKNDYNINFASNFLLESYCWRTFEEVNQHLRSTFPSPTDEFIIAYTSLLNKLLDSIESHDNQVVWRWVTCFEGFDFLTKNVGKTILIPEFKSTSKRKLPNRTYWRIKTANKSNGKEIFRHIDKAKGEMEQEILFKTNSIFRITFASKSMISLKELETEDFDIVLSDKYWEEE